MQRDLEIVDVLAIANKEGKLLVGEGSLADHIDPKKHTNLSVLEDTPQARMEVIQHLRVSVWSSYIKDLYEELTIYLQGLVFETIRCAHDPSLARSLVRNRKLSVSYSDILACNDIDELVEKLAQDTLRALDRIHSTKQMISELLEKLSLDVEEKLVEKALPYLNLRHQLVHADGAVDEKFKTENPTIPIRWGKAFITYKLTRDATQAISRLVDAFDQDAVAKGILAEM